MAGEEGAPRTAQSRASRTVRGVEEAGNSRKKKTETEQRTHTSVEDQGHANGDIDVVLCGLLLVDGHWKHDVLQSRLQMGGHFHGTCEEKQQHIILISAAADAVG